jgi:Tfp pilus assembly pilus retraction ATPase PilT
MLDVSKLPPLTSAEWPLLSDITIPVNVHESGGEPGFGGTAVVETDFQAGVCFLGDLAARRLYTEGSQTAANILPLVAEAHAKIDIGRRRFRLQAGGLTFRAQLGHTATGHDLTLRVLPTSCPRLDDLRLPAALKALLLGRNLLDGGLVLIVAPHGQGKTTTASATVVSRLEAFGGYAQTIEDPCELPMQGVWGKGVCIQRPAEIQPGDETPGDAFFRSMLDSMRQFPAIPHGTQLLVGEIQDSRTATETLKAAIHGHLVIATLHARSPADAIRRLTAMCSSGRDNLDAETARELVAAAVRGVWYQTLMRDSTAEGWGRGRLGGTILWNDPKLAKHITAGKYDVIAEVANKQTEALNAMNNQTGITAAMAASSLSRFSGN